MKLSYTLCILLLPFLLHAKDNANNSVIRAVPNSSVIEFVKNNGQWDGPFTYKAIVGNGTVFLQNDGFTYLLEDPANLQRIDAYHHGILTQPPVVKFHAYKIRFSGAQNPSITGSKERETYYNYFLGNDPSRWKSNIHPYLAIDYKELYAGIDMHVSSQKGNIKYEFEVQPGANAEQIQLSIEGADRLTIKNGNLLISTSVGIVQELKPFAYQYINDQRIEIACNYSLKHNTVSYEFPDGYDKTKMLIIDPTVIFCTFTGSVADNWGFTATYDQLGNFYAGGLVHSTGFPVTTGAFQSTFGGGSSATGSNYAADIGIMKFNSGGNSRIYATYIGGSDNEQPHSLIVDASNNLIIAGRTYSTNYPTISGCYDVTQNGGADIVVTKLKYDGTALLSSTYVGGSGDDVVNFDAVEATFGNLKHNYGDDARSEVQVDKQGNIYVAACTKSSNFPVTSSAFQSTNGGSQDGVVFKLNSTLTSLLWSTYLGGVNDDAAYVLAFDTSQTHIYVAGGTQSTNFPSTSGTYHTTFQGGSTDGFIVRFGNGGTYPFEKGTFIGRNDYDQCYGVQVDLANSVYAMGQTLGGTFPVTSGVYSNANSSQFVIKLDSNLSTNIYSTVFGSGDNANTNVSPVAFLVDTCQNVYISGWGGNLGFSPGGTTTVTGMPITASTAIKTTTDGFDFYFIVLSRDASSLLYGSFFGRNSSDVWRGEHVDGGTSRFNKNGVIYQAICGGCAGTGGTASAFPTTSGAWSEADSSSNCNLAALKIAFDLGAVKAEAKASPDTRGCLPFTVHFLDSSVNATYYSWDFGDGGKDTVRYPVHTFTSAGVFQVRLIINNPKACKELDTAYLTITVDTNFIRPSFTWALVDSCDSFNVAFTNTSAYSHTPGASSFTTFFWDFGDGNTYKGITPPVHYYASKGSYTARLVMTDSTACNSPDTVSQTFTLDNVLVTAKFFAPDSVCKGEPVRFDDSSAYGTAWSWFFGEGNTATTASATHTFDTVGTFSVMFVVSNPGSCNGSDTFIKTITVLDVPHADFSFSPVVAETNVPTTFTNLSVNATRYAWVFGDGGLSSEVNPVHRYKRSGSYNVCLYARNSSNCPAYLCRLVTADVKPLADLPSAFSPNGDGSNDILFVRGAGIVTMDLQIFNRWGVLLFESNDQRIGWDGTFNGQPQPMEAYAYVLHVTFIDDTKLVKKGNVTLLR